VAKVGILLATHTFTRCSMWGLLGISAGEATLTRNTGSDRSWIPCGCVLGCGVALRSRTTRRLAGMGPCQLVLMSIFRGFIASALGSVTLRTPSL
jgi:hypothetical protein